MAVLNSRFPVIAGMEVTWSSTSPPGQRVKSVELVSHRKAVADRLGQPADEGGESDDEEDSDASEGGEVVQLAEGVECELKKKTYRHREPIKREKGGRSYNVVTRECQYLSPPLWPLFAIVSDPP